MGSLPRPVAAADRSPPRTVVVIVAARGGLRSHHPFAGDRSPIRPARVPVGRVSCACKGASSGAQVRHSPDGHASWAGSDRPPAGVERRAPAESQLSSALCPLPSAISPQASALSPQAVATSIHSNCRCRFNSRRHLGRLRQKGLVCMKSYEGGLKCDQFKRLVRPTRVVMESEYLAQFNHLPQPDLACEFDIAGTKVGKVCVDVCSDRLLGL